MKPVPSLSKRLFVNILVLALSGIVIIGVTVGAIAFVSIEKEASSSLELEARKTAQALDGLTEEEQASLLGSQVSGQIRFTLISGNGEVLFDSAAQESAAADDYLAKPEVREALDGGSGSSERYSETLAKDTLYSAVLLSNGSVVRLSETRDSIFEFFENYMLLPLLALVLVTVVCVLLFSRFLAKRIALPFNQIDMAAPLSSPPYEEAIPMLERIDSQQKVLLEQNARLAEVETMRRDFSANVSHEMKTPLQVISGYAELMKNGMVSQEDIVRFSGLIYQEALSMRSLIDDVLMLSKLDADIEDAPKELVDLFAVSARVVERLQKLACDLDVELVLTGEHVSVVGNETLLEQLVYNLVENGIRYNKSGGKVSVSLSKTVLDDGRGEVTLVVADTGIGIPQDSVDKVFERFYRVDKSRSKATGGTGLGLAIVKHAVMRHGGEIKVASEKGAGTTMTVVFDAAQEQ